MRAGRGLPSDRGRGHPGRSFLAEKYRHAISEFRRRHLAAFERLFVEVLRLAAASGLWKVGRLALDGTKIKAFSEIASRHGLATNRAMSYDRRQTEEVRLQQEIRERLAQAEAEDRAEDAQHGANRRGDELPDERPRRESRLTKIREAKAALEAEARARAAAENAAREAEGKGPKHADLDPVRVHTVRPDPKAQRHSPIPTRGSDPRRTRAEIRVATFRWWSMNRNSSSRPT